MPSPRRSPGQLLQETREHWPLMNHYERFEHVVAFILGLIIALVIALALLQLLTRVVPLLLTGAIDPLDHEVFQGLFGMIMTLLIALEFKHSIIRVALRRESIVQVKTVVLIALLALSRKFIVLDSKVTEAQTIGCPGAGHARPGRRLLAAPRARRSPAEGRRHGSGSWDGRQVTGLRAASQHLRRLRVPGAEPRLRAQHRAAHRLEAAQCRRLARTVRPLQVGCVN